MKNKGVESLYRRYDQKCADAIHARDSIFIPRTVLENKYEERVEKGKTQNLARGSDEPKFLEQENEIRNIDLQPFLTKPLEEKPDKRGSAQKKKEELTLEMCSEKLKDKVVLICIEEYLHFYNRYCYQVINQNQLVQLYRDRVDSKLHGEKRMHIFYDLYKYLQADSSIKVELTPEKLSNIVVLKNGIYDIRKRKLLQHSKDIIALSYVDAFYVENGDCSRFEEFLEDVTGGNETLIKRMWMALSYILMQSNDAKVFFVMGQASNSGKSLFGHFIQNLFETQYVSSIALTDMNKEFSLGQIVGKAVNVSLDLPRTKLNASAVSRLKMLTGGDLITISEKYVPQFKYQNRAKFIFASNHPIELMEDDEAFWNRMIYLPFDYSVSKEEQNANLLKELLEEKDAIVSKAIKYARILVENNYEFPTTPEIEKRIRQWRGIEEDSINEFIKKCCYIDSECRGELMEDLHVAYLQFCADIDVKAVNRAVLKQYLEKQIGLVHFKMRRGNTDNPQSAFKGIGLLTRGGSL